MRSEESARFEVCIFLGRNFWPEREISTEQLADGDETTALLLSFRSHENSDFSLRLQLDILVSRALQRSKIAHSGRFIRTGSIWKNLDEAE